MAGPEAFAPRIFMVAGEPSGDAIGARLIAALNRASDEKAIIEGIGGPQMIESGLSSLFPMDELSIMGVVEVLPHLRQLSRRLDQTVAAIVEFQPDVVVTIDSPGFCLRVQRRLLGMKLKRVHFVAPQVWAWKAHRAKRLAGEVDHLLALLPFEPPLFEVHGLPTTFVGHPAVERVQAAMSSGAFRNAHGIPEQAPLLCVLPGSRRSEVRRLLPVFQETAARLAEHAPELHTVLPTVPNVAADVRAAVGAWPTPLTVTTTAHDKYGAFNAANAALAASGTVATELAIAGTPTVIGYRMNWLTGLLAKRFVKLRYVSLPNIVLGREVQPEYLLEACTVDNLTPAVAALLGDKAARSRALADGAAAASAMGAGREHTPSQAAADQILALIARTSYGRQGGTA